MAYPDSSDVAGGDKITATQYNNLRSDALGISGEIKMYGGSAAPTGWMICDGSAISRTTYATLYGVIGTKYGAGNGSSTFNIPDLEGRVPVGLDSTITDFNDRGKTGGSKTHQLTEAELAKHHHGIAQEVAAGGGTDGREVDYSTGKQNNTTYIEEFTHANGTYPYIKENGGDAAHENMPPYVIVNYIIKT